MTSTSLPNDVLFEILLKANPTELNRLCQSDRRFAALCSNDELWHKKYINSYGNIGLHQRSADTWKNEFMYREPLKSNENVYVIKIIFPGSNDESINLAVFRAYNTDEIYNRLAGVLNNILADPNRQHKKTGHWGRTGLDQHLESFYNLFIRIWNKNPEINKELIETYRLDLTDELIVPPISGYILEEINKFMEHKDTEQLVIDELPLYRV